MYSFSFVFGGLLIPETEVVVRLFSELGDWDRVKEKVMDENLLKKTRKSSSYRYVREIRDRLKQAEPWELDLILDDDLHVRQLTLFLLVCRYYSFIRDFYKEVVSYKFQGNDYHMTEYDYPAFFENKEEEHPEMTSLTDSTKEKVRTVVFRILREAGILGTGKKGMEIAKPYVPEKMVGVYEQHGALEKLSLLLE